MNLIQRFKNLYRLSEIEVTANDKVVVTDKEITHEPIYKQAQIVKMKSPTREFLDKNKNEE